MSNHVENWPTQVELKILLALGEDGKHGEQLVREGITLNPHTTLRRLEKKKLVKAKTVTPRGAEKKYTRINYKPTAMGKRAISAIGWVRYGKKPSV